jgi:hypothetical protein
MPRLRRPLHLLMELLLVLSFIQLAANRASPTYISAIWNNSGDCGYLYDHNGNEVSKYYD